jgi:oligopeptide/dipeptide ABC transporter ATP-binding protein
MIDVSMRLGILRLLRDLRDRLGVSLLLITHDVATARYIGPGSDLYVLYRGKLVEQGRTETLIRRPVHPYTQCLISATPVLRGIEEPGPDRVMPSGPPEELLEPPGCLFEPPVPVRRARLPVAAAASGPPRRDRTAARLPLPEAALSRGGARRTGAEVTCGYG